jgi:DNA-binding MltR family transcriptional regulator
MSKNKKKSELFNRFREEDFSYWDDFLNRELNAESDRGAVILACSLFDIALKAKIKSFLTPISSSADEIFDDANAPLATFSSKINMAFRLGIISQSLKRDLHLLRDIRNSFAHNIEECSFEAPEITSTLKTIKEQSKFIDRFKEIRESCFQPGNKGDFIMFATMLLSTLKSEHVTTMEQAVDEWIYNPEFQNT